MGPELQVTDGQSFVAAYRAYFQKESYRFPATSPTPLIIDGGANVGVGVRYWKRLHPTARVIAFECDPASFAALQRNTADLHDVTLRPEALWTENGTMEFAAVGADGGHLTAVGTGNRPPQTLRVSATRLRDLLTEPVDLLKLDIEGAETDVLLDCHDRLSCVRHLFVEYHSFADRPQRLGLFFGALEQAGFRVHAHPDCWSQQPFISCPVSNGKDFRLNVFCFRP